MDFTPAELQAELQRIADEVKKNLKDGVLTVDFEDVTKIPRSNYADFFLNPTLSDINIIVGEDEAVIPCHKIVLAAHSEAFANLFGNFELDSTDIAIKDVGYEGLCIFLEYVYTHNTSIPEQTMFDVLKLAVRFGVEQLESKAIDCIRENITMENAFDFLDKCLKLEHTLMIEILFRYIGRNILTIIEREYYLTASYDALLAFIGQPIADSPEKDLAEMCVKWSKQKCQEANKEPTPDLLRHFLGEILHKIRFPLMKVNEFENFVGVHKLLDETELSNYHRYFLGLRNNNVMHWQTVKRTLDFVNISGPFESVAFTRGHASVNVAYPNNFERGIKVKEKTYVCGIGIRIKKSVKLVEGAYLVINNTQIDLGENFKRCYRQNYSQDEDLIVVKFPLVFIVEAGKIYDFCFYNPNGFGIGCNEIIYAVGTDNEEFWHSRPYAPEKENNALKYLIVRNNENVFETKLFTDFIF